MLTVTQKIEPATENQTMAKVMGARVRAPFSVFLVDDDNIFLRTLEHHLQHKLKHNVKISTFPNGEECIKQIRLSAEQADKKPDVVVLDYILNGQYPSAMNGVAVLKKIKELAPETITIMLSGQDKMQVAIDTLKYGAYDYVIKNENAFLKVQNDIKNAIHHILLARELKNYKRGVKLVLAIVGFSFLAAIIIQLFFPQYFHLNE